MCICNEDHTDIVASLEGLPRSQKNDVRHVCAGCAYDRGFKDGMRTVLNELRYIAEAQMKHAGIWKLVNFVERVTKELDDAGR